MSSEKKDLAAIKASGKIIVNTSKCIASIINAIKLSEGNLPDVLDAILSVLDAVPH
jgi:hypothetical protein